MIIVALLIPASSPGERSTTSFVKPSIWERRVLSSCPSFFAWSGLLHRSERCICSCSEAMRASFAETSKMPPDLFEACAVRLDGGFDLFECHRRLSYQTNAEDGGALPLDYRTAAIEENSAAPTAGGLIGPPTLPVETRHSPNAR